ncbi:hypothetical protein KY290_028030 [Solanum tuberosum]|uniref:CS domain-containing protein n=1 Tax=Solanum tuberosum TaxID=4113 RepID=A0ABQ7UHX9_SOLTU|nr:hypothetical protein KY290_028030 [Solanum tuberosum]
MVIIFEYNEQDDKPPSSSPVSPKPSNETRVEEAFNATEKDKKGNGLDLDNYSCGQSVQEVKEANNTTEAIEENKKRLLAPNIGNGLDLDNYSWDQSVQEVKEAINTTEAIEENKKGILEGPLTPILCYTILIALSGDMYTSPNIENGLGLDNYSWGQSLQEGELYRPVKVEACFWTLEDQKSISVLLTKIDKVNWWKWVVKGEPELDTEKVEPEITRLSKLDPEIQSSVETIMFHQRQEAMGLPTLDEMQN